MKYRKAILSPGKHQVTMMDGTRKEVDFTPERILHWAEEHAVMKSRGLNIPAPWRHDRNATPRFQGDAQDSNAFQNSGFWDRLWVDDKGVLMGEVDVPNATDIEKIGTSVKEVSPLILPEWKDDKGNIYKDVITHVALVTHPQISGQENFVPATDALAAAMAFSSEGMLLAAPADSSASSGTTDGLNAQTKGGSGKPFVMNASSASIQDALKILAQIGLTLPADTTPDNLLERIVVGGGAIANKDGADDESMHDLPSGATTRPQPVAMSQEIQMLPKFDPETGKALTPAEAAALQAKLSGVALSNEAALNVAKKTALKSYHSRIVALIPRVGKEYAEKTLLPILNGPDGQGMALSFDPTSGEPVSNALDTILDTLEKLPGKGLVGANPSKGVSGKPAALFSLQGMSPQALGLAHGNSTTLEGAEYTIENAPDFEEAQVSPDQAESIVDTIMAGCGRGDLTSRHLHGHMETVANPAGAHANN
jgi:hypothetical protein